ncbi:MAG: hypothetical protein RLZZ330_875, partial [Actinomycetota bacterium]
MSEEVEQVVPNLEPLLSPADGLTPLIDNQNSFDEAVEQIISGHGPVALDAERASSYRYTAKAYLIQIRRNGAGTFLIDPTVIQDFSKLSDFLKSEEWILHAATQDLSCLAEVDLVPTKLFDTEHAGRLLGKQKVGLAGLLESEFGIGLQKEHSAADWSTRPLPEPWLIYAALDVEKLIELREALKSQLENMNRWNWAEQDFHALASWKPAAALADPWRKTSGIHQVRQPRQLAIVRELWIEREKIAQEKDKAVSRVLPDAAIIDIAKNELKSARDVYMLESLRNRSHKAYADLWWEVRTYANGLKESELPSAKTGIASIPPTKAWEEKN